MAKFLYFFNVLVGHLNFFKKWRPSGCKKQLKIFFPSDFKIPLRGVNPSILGSIYLLTLFKRLFFVGIVYLLELFYHNYVTYHPYNVLALGQYSFSIWELYLFPGSVRFLWWPHIRLHGRTIAPRHTVGHWIRHQSRIERKRLHHTHGVIHRFHNSTGKIFLSFFCRLTDTKMM